MGSSRDLNTLKSWNPKSLKNKISVKKLEERLIQREKQLEKESKKREVEDLASLKSNNLSWMYDTPKQEVQPIKKEPIKEKIDKQKMTKVNKSNKSKPKYDYSKLDPMAKIKK